jgi:chorismate mutase
MSKGNQEPEAKLLQLRSERVRIREQIARLNSLAQTAPASDLTDIALDLGELHAEERVLASQIDREEMKTSVSQTERLVREGMGLSKHRKPVPIPVPSVPAKKEGIVDIDGEVKRHPELGYYVRKDRSAGFSEHTIGGMIATYKKELGIKEVEDRVRDEMGVRTKKEPAEASKLERLVRQGMGMRRRDNQ